MAGDGLYERAKTVFLQACDAAGEDRAALVESLCAGDEALRVEVEALLSHDEDDDTLDVSGARPPGSRIGAYTVVRTLGAGSMGVVYEAEQAHPKRTVAIKVGRSGVSAASLRRRLEHEVSALARLQHPGIAAVYDSGVDGATGEPYFVMELVHGEPITQNASRRGLSVPERVELIAGVCDAVHHAHLRGVIHRDLKPSNILVDASGRARVLDFGIARIEDEDSTLRTMPGQVMGTLGFMSPEQASGDRDAIDARADIYALGSIAYELLAGVPALDLSGKPMHEAIRVIQQQDPVRLGTIDRRLRGDLETIVATAMEKDPARRYQSAEGLAGDLRRALRDEPITARAPTTFYQIGKFVRRRRGLVGAAGVIAATLIAATAVSTVFAVRADAQRARAERRFGQVRALANTFLFDIHDQIEPLVGSIKARRSLVRTGLAYLDSLAGEAGDDPELLGELAEAYFRVGDIQGNPRRSNLGDVEASLASYGHSIDIRRRIDRIAPSAENSLALIRTHIAVGETTTSSEHAGDALGHFRAARDGLVSMLEVSPGDVESLGALGLAEGRIGGVLREMGRPGEALAHFLGSLDAARRVVEIEPGAEAERTLSIALNEVGLTLVRLGRPLEALPHYERSMAIRAAAAEREPHSARALRDLALAHHRMVDVFQSTNDPEAALRHNLAALESLAALHRADPADARSRFDLSVAHDKTAGALADLGRPAEALDAYMLALELRRELAAEFPDNLFYLKGFTAAQEQVANALRTLNRHDEAQQAYLAAISLGERCNATDAGDMRVWTAIAVSQRGLGESLLAQAGDAPQPGDERLAEAAGWFRASLATLAHMEREGMKPVRSGVNREELTALLARCLPESPAP